MSSHWLQALALAALGASASAKCLGTLGDVTYIRGQTSLDLAFWGDTMSLLVSSDDSSSISVSTTYGSVKTSRLSSGGSFWNCWSSDGPVTYSCPLNKFVVTIWCDHWWPWEWCAVRYTATVSVSSCTTSTTRPTTTTARPTTTTAWPTTTTARPTTTTAWPTTTTAWPTTTTAWPTTTTAWPTTTTWPTTTPAPTSTSPAPTWTPWPTTTTWLIVTPAPTPPTWTTWLATTAAPAPSPTPPPSAAADSWPTPWPTPSPTPWPAYSPTPWPAPSPSPSEAFCSVDEGSWVNKIYAGSAVATALSLVLILLVSVPLCCRRLAWAALWIAGPVAVLGILMTFVPLMAAASACDTVVGELCSRCITCDPNERAIFRDACIKYGIHLASSVGVGVLPMILGPVAFCLSCGVCCWHACRKRTTPVVVMSNQAVQVVQAVQVEPPPRATPVVLSGAQGAAPKGVVHAVCVEAVHVEPLRGAAAGAAGAPWGRPPVAVARAAPGVPGACDRDATEEDFGNGPV